MEGPATTDPGRGGRRLARRVAAGGLVSGALALLVLSVGAQGWALYHLRRAKRDLEQHRTGPALRHLRLCRKVWPHDPEACVLTARTARRAGRREEAIEALRELRRRGDVPEAVDLEYALMRAEDGDPRALAEVQRAAEGGGDEAPLLLEAACRGYLHHQRWPEALRAARQLAGLQPSNPLAWYWQGQVREHAGELLSALEDLRRAIDLDPNQADARRLLGFVLLSLNRFADAAAHFERLLEEHPDDPRVLGGLACCWRSLGRLREASGVLERLLGRAPDLAPALAERGRLALDQGRSAEAEGWLRRAMGLNPNSTETRYSLFVCLSRQGKEGEAAECLKLLKQQEFRDRRIRALHSEILRSPREVKLRHELGVLLLQGPARDQGLKTLTNLLQEEPGHAPTHAALAGYYEKSGDPRRAEAHRRRAAAPGKSGSPPRADR